MTVDLDETTTRLVACLRAFAAAVSDEPPGWDPTRRLSAFEQPHQHRLARRPLAVALLAAVVIAAILTWKVGHHTTTLRATLIAATEHTVGAHTARIRVSGTPTGGQTTTATGVVNFDIPAATFSYPSGFAVIIVGNQSWETVWPSVNGTVQWDRQPPDPHPSSPAGADLGRALQPDTAPDSLLRALRADTKTFTDFGADQAAGVHYRATFTSAWQADVWVANGNLVRIAVRAPTGTVVIDYSDFGVPVSIQPPAERLPATSR